MFTVAVMREQMYKRTRGQQQVRQESKDMGPVLLPEEKRGDREKDTHSDRGGRHD
jgi:hypothetical protein